MKKLSYLGILSLSLSVGCEKEPEIGTLVISLTSQEKKQYSKPDIRHKTYSFESRASGQKLIEPERLNNIITTLLQRHGGDELNPNPIDPTFSTMGSSNHNRYPLYLGGLDYDPITRRTTEVTATMPLVIERLALQVCQSLDLGDRSVDDLHRILCSRPIDSLTQESVDHILSVTQSEGM